MIFITKIKIKKAIKIILLSKKKKMREEKENNNRYPQMI
jgi:hypothetical protein|nr:MAG TPA: hypothetical protein [Caudoviricetes sp.]DAR86361.1 MAG TPA: hypothetical protein [Caudoviricetes sp.]